MTTTVTDRAKAVDKARKVFLHGSSSNYAGEKEICLQRLTALLQQHRLSLFDLNSKFPKRLDLVLLRGYIGLDTPATAATTQADRSTAAPAGQESRQPRSGRSEQGKRGAHHGKTTSSGARGGQPDSDLEALFFQQRSHTERQRLLNGPKFSQGLLRVVQGTSAYGQLLTEMESLNSSSMGTGLGRQLLTQWLEKVLSRQGSQVVASEKAMTLFEDVLAFCRADYLLHLDQQRIAAAAEAERREKERGAQQQAEEDRQRKRREWDEQVQQAKARRAAEEARQKAQAGPETIYEFGKDFEDRAEASLFLKVVRRVISDPGRIRSSSRGALYHVEFDGTGIVEAQIDKLYQRALEDLQMAAEMIRQEAARVRDEAVHRAGKEYAQQCSRALQIAVDKYRP